MHYNNDNLRFIALIRSFSNYDRYIEKVVLKYS
jgi:hypothetical protein